MKIIIYGANETGSMIAAEFFEDYDITIVDPDPEKLEKFDRLDIASICGAPTNLNVLKEADIKNCDFFIACDVEDEKNIVACLIAKQLSCTKIVCFVSRKECQDSLRTIRDDVSKDSAIYIDNVIWPEKLLTQEIFRIVTVPEAIDVENFAQGKARLLEYRIKEDAFLVSKMLKDCDFPAECLLVGVVRDEELIIPTGDTKLLVNDKAIFMGTPEGLDICAGRFFAEKNKVKNVTIIGGGAAGFELAKILEQTPAKTKVIENNFKRCEYLSENLKKSLVLHADGTNLELLSEENIGESDVIISVTDNDEKNLLCSLLAKQLGAKKIISRVEQEVTASLFERVGVDVAISPKRAAVDEVKNRIVQGHADILATVERGLGEILEIDISCDFVDTEVMKLKLPARALIASIQRSGKVLIPKGRTLVRGRDKLIIFTKAQDVKSVREYFKK